MRFVSLVNALVGRARRGITQASSVANTSANEDIAADPADIAKTLRQVMLRVNKLEAASSPEGLEFEVQLPGNGGTIELQHNLGTQVRWYVTSWQSSLFARSPFQAPLLTYDPTSTSKLLVLRSYEPGRAVVRVEPTQGFVDNGPTLDQFGVPLIPTINRLTSLVSVAATQIVLIPVPDNSSCVWRVTVIGQNKTTLATRAFSSFYMQARRQLAAAPADVLTFVTLNNLTAGMVVAIVGTATGISITVQCTTAAQTVDWTCKVEPIHSYLRDEP